MSSVIENGYIALTTKPKARLSYSFVNSKGPASQPAYLTVFLNGLGLPQSSWLPTIEGIMANRSAYPAMLTYDRYGHGTSTDRDPLDELAADPSRGHTCNDITHDLHQLITQISSTKLSHSNLRLVFVASSIGCAIARLYAQEYPSTVAALLLLDSIVANSDYVSMVPDPDAPGADTSTATEEELRATRAGFAAVYHPITGTHGTAEGLDRRNLAEMLPSANHPVLEGNPWVTVVQHDREVFATQLLEMMNVPNSITRRYVSPACVRYFEGMVEITAEEKRKGPIVASGCGHYIHKDAPEFVIKEIVGLLDKLGI